MTNYAKVTHYIEEKVCLFNHDLEEKASCRGRNANEVQKHDSGQNAMF